MRRYTLLIGLAIALLVTMPLRLMGQDVPIDPADPFAGMPEILGLLLPIVIGYVTPNVFEGLQSAITWLEQLPVLAKKGAVLVIAFVLTIVTTLTGIVLPGGLEGFTPAAISSALSMFIAFGYHKYKKDGGGTANA